MRRRPSGFVAAGFAALAVACAHVEPPPGGPEDRDPPFVTMTVPDTGAIVPGFRDDVVFEFSERISERGVEEAILVSPRTSPVQIDRGRSGVRVSLRRGWEPGVIYQVTLLPQIQDLFNNGLAEQFRLVFSTGPEIPDTRVTGRVIDRITGRPADATRIEAIRTADSLVYSAATTAEGTFEMSRIPAGDYLFRAYLDVGRNRELDDYESRDTSFAAVSGGDPTELEFSLLEPDSTPPRIRTVTADSVTVHLEFDDFLDPFQTVGPEQITLTGDAGTMTVLRAVIGELPDSIGAPADSTMLPSQRLSIELAEGQRILPAVDYGIQVRGIRNVNGLAGGDAEEFVVEETPAQR